VSTYAPLAIDEAGSLWFGIYNRAGSMHVLMDAAGTFDIHPSESAGGESAGGGALAADTDERAGARTTGQTSFGGRVLADPSLPAPAVPGGRTSTRG
jgi:hypothetical protein